MFCFREVPSLACFQKCFPIDDALLRARVATHLGLKDAAQGLEAANRTIEEQAEHLQMVMDSATISIFSLNIEGKITSANQMTAEMTGQPVADLIGTSFADLIDDDDPAGAEALVTKVIDDGFFVSNHEARVRHADGRQRIAILSMPPCITTVRSPASSGKIRIRDSG